MSLEILTRLNPKTSSMELSIPATGERLTPDQIAASLHRLKDYEYTLLMVLNAGWVWVVNGSKDYRTYMDLKEAIYKAANIRWPKQRDSRQKLVGLCDFVIYHHSYPNKCHVCHGRGFIGHIPCEACNQTGEERVKPSKIYRPLEIDKSNWRKIWQERYEMLRGGFLHVKGVAEKKVER